MFGGRLAIAVAAGRQNIAIRGSSFKTRLSPMGRHAGSPVEAATAYRKALPKWPTDGCRIREGDRDVDRL
jgi:hypothetical protein